MQEKSVPARKPVINDSMHPSPTLDPQVKPVSNSMNPTPVKKLPSGSPMPMVIAIAVVAIFMGVGTGWALANMNQISLPQSQTTLDMSNGEVESTPVEVEENKDSAEGTIKEGGLFGEGSHRLERGLGEDKDVALTSSSLDLSGFEGKKVQIWGENITSPNVYWLMDVSKVKVLE